MSILGCVSKGFAVVKSSGSLLLTFFLFSFAFALIGLVAIPAEAAPDANPTPVAVALGVIFMLISIFIQSGSIGYIEQVVKQGKSSLAVFAEAGKKSYLRMFGLGVVVFLLMLVMAVVAVLGFVLTGGGAGPNPVAIVLAVVLALIGVVLLSFIFLAPYAVVVDGKGVFGAIKMSAGIVKRKFWAVALVGLILVGIGFVLGLVLGLVGGLLGNALASAMPAKAGQAVSALVSSAVNAVLTVFTTGAFMALYLSGKSSSGEAPAVN